MATEALTVDQAVAELVSAPDAAAETPTEKDQANAAQEAPELEEIAAEPTSADDVSEAVDETDPGDDAEQEPEPQAEAEAVDAPQWWDADAKGQFAKLPPEVQAVVRAQEDKREAVVQKAKQDASGARKAADGELQKLTQVSRALAESLPLMVQAHKEYWGDEGYDLKANIQEYGAEQALVFQAEFQERQTALHKLVQAKTEADHQAQLAWQRVQREKMVELCPDLADPKEGAAREKELAGFLLENGAETTDLEVLPAWSIPLVRDAMAHRKALAEAKAKAKAPKQAVPVARPTAPPSQTSSEKSVTQLRQRLAKTGSVDDAVALVLAEDEARRRA